MNCKELVEIITEYFENTLPPEVRARFEAHLSACPSCQIYLDQMRLTVRKLGSLSEDALSQEAQATLLEAFRNWKKNLRQDDERP